MSFHFVIPQIQSYRRLPIHLQGKRAELETVFTSWDILSVVLTHDFSKDTMLSVQPGSVNGADEELE